MRKLDHCTGFWPTPGTVPTWGPPPILYDDSKVAVAGDPGGGNRRGIVIMCHPTLGLVDRVKQPPHVLAASPEFIAYHEFASALSAIGWASVYPVLPLDYSPQGVVSVTGTAEEQILAGIASNDAGHGTIFRDHIVPATFDHLASYLSKKFNKLDIPLIPFGYSLGAYMALIMSLHASPTVQPQIKGFISHELPTLWQNVNTGVQYFSGNTSGIDLDANALTSWTKRAIIGYSAQDGAVGYTSSASPGPVSNVQAIIANSPSSVTGQDRSHSGVSWPSDHLFLSPDATAYTSWISSNLNPTTPITF